ncbi:MAG: hypothetical protein ACI3XQ_02150, partial [Eubacteriales bacterium]
MGILVMRGKLFKRKGFPRTPFKSFRPVIIYPNPKFLKEGRGEENFFGEVSSPQKQCGIVKKSAVKKLTKKFFG